MKFPFKTKRKVLSHVNSFLSDIYKKCQKWFWMFEAYLERKFVAHSLCGFDLGLEAGSR
jgi:hypothetical protein